MSDKNGKMVVVCNHADPPHVMPTLIMGSSGVALGNEVILFFCPGGAQALLKGVRSPLDSLAVNNARILCAQSLAARELGKLAQRTDLHPLISELAAYHEFRALHTAGRVDGARQKALPRRGRQVSG